MRILRFYDDTRVFAAVKRFAAGGSRFGTFGRSFGLIGRSFGAVGTHFATVGSSFAVFGSSFAVIRRCFAVVLPGGGRPRLIDFLVRAEINENGGFGVFKIKNDPQVIFHAKTPVAF